MEKHSESRLSYLFAHLHLLSSDLFSSDSSHLCFSTVHIVGSIASKLPSIIWHYNYALRLQEGAKISKESSPTGRPPAAKSRNRTVCKTLLPGRCGRLRLDPSPVSEPQIASSGRCGLGLDPNRENATREECQRESRFQIECENRRQIECQNICQKECQNIYI